VVIFVFEQIYKYYVLLGETTISLLFWVHWWQLVSSSTSSFVICSCYTGFGQETWPIQKGGGKTDWELTWKRPLSCHPMMNQQTFLLLLKISLIAPPNKI